jgi:hypothetical protein
MALSSEQVSRIKRMDRDELVSNAQSEDLGVLVEATLRLHRTIVHLHWSTWVLNGVLILLTAVIAYAAFKFGHT